MHQIHSLVTVVQMCCLPILTIMSIPVFIVAICHDFFHFFFIFKQKTAYELRISDWSSDVCSSDLPHLSPVRRPLPRCRARPGPVPLRTEARVFTHRGAARSPWTRSCDAAHGRASGPRLRPGATPIFWPVLFPSPAFRHWGPPPFFHCCSTPHPSTPPPSPPPPP